MALDLYHLAQYPVLKIIASLENKISEIWRTRYPLPPVAFRHLIGVPHPIFYLGSSRTYLNLFIGPGGLKPWDDVLDVGCGCGHLAVPLSAYLSSSARFEGFDINPEMIDWCVNVISSAHPNFHFQVADIYNQKYNPAGKLKARQYKFPYQDNSFSFVYLKSVFTHMLPDDLENYLSEISRVLRKGGRCFITYFLLNPESRALIKAKSSMMDYDADAAVYSPMTAECPEGAVAYAEDYIRNLYAKYGFKISQPVYYGSWCSRKYFLDSQDIIIAAKL